MSLTSNSKNSNVGNALTRRARRLLKKAFAHASSRGEKNGCACCGVTLKTYPLPYLIGLLGKDVVAVCNGCENKLTGKPFMAGVWDAEPDWKGDDRIWFKENPKRRYRLRLPFPQEIAASELSRDKGRSFLEVEVAIAVWQHKDGRRLRASVPRPGDSFTSFTEAGIAKLMEIAGHGNVDAALLALSNRNQPADCLRRGLEQAGVKIPDKIEQDRTPNVRGVRQHDV